jgi:hypothetical protein
MERFPVEAEIRKNKAIPSLKSVTRTLYVPIIVAIIGLIILVLGFSLYSSRLLLSNTGIDTQAIVIDRQIDIDDEGHRSYRITYQYKVVSSSDDSIQIHEGSASVSRSEYEQLAIGDEVPIVYAAKKPTLSRMGSTKDEYDPAAILPIVIIIPIICFLPLLWRLIELPEILSLDKNGVITTGKIIDVWKEESSGKCYVAYTFGRDHGAVQRIDYSDYLLIEEGIEVPIRFHKANPKLSRMEILSIF